MQIPQWRKIVGQRRGAPMRPTPPESRWRVPGRGGPSGLRGARKRQPVPRLRDGVARTRASWRRLPDQAAIGCARIVREEEEGGGGKEGGGGQLQHHNPRVKSVGLGPHAAVWPPSLGCPLGRSLPRLPMGWRGLARGLCTSPPMVVHPGCTQLSGFEVRFLVSGPREGGRPSCGGDSASR